MAMLYSCLILASTPGRPLGEGRSGIDCLHMCRVFCIFSSKINRKLNLHEGLAPFEVKGVNIYNTLIQRVYGEHTITSFFLRVILHMRKQLTPGLSSPRGRPGVEASLILVLIDFFCMIFM